MIKLIKNTSLYTIGNILPQAVGFILLPIYTRFLTPEDYGIVNSMQVLGAILTVIFTLAINNSIYRLYFDYKTEKEKKDYLGTISISLFFISLIVLLLLFLFKGSISQIFKTIEFYPFYFYAIITSFFAVYSIIPKIYFQVNEKATKFVVVSILQFILNTGFVLWFVIVEKAGATGMLKGLMLANIAILPLFIYISYTAINFTFKLRILKASIRFSLPLIPSIISAWVLNLSDRIFIERYFNLHDVGIYSLAYKIAGLILVFSSAFTLAYSPVFYKLANSKDQVLAKKTLIKYNHIYIIVLLIFVFIITFFSKEVIYLLLDPKYFEAYKLVPIIAFSYLISQITGLFNLSIYQEKKTTQIMYMIISSAVINILLNFLLVPKWGAYGAALATVLSFLFLFIIAYLYSKKCYFIPIKWKQISLLLSVFFILFILFQNILNLNILTSLALKLLVTSVLIFFGLKKYYLQLIIIFKKG